MDKEAAVLETDLPGGLSWRQNLVSYFEIGQD